MFLEYLEIILYTGLPSLRCHALRDSGQISKTYIDKGISVCLRKALAACAIEIGES